MCHSADSRAPSPPDTGTVSWHGPVRTATEDGRRPLGTYMALPGTGTANGRNVVVLPDVRGLHPYYADLAVRFAEAGFGAVAIDYFARTAGPRSPGQELDWRAHLPSVRPEHVRADVLAAAAALRERSPGPLFTVGFCFGGGHSWRLAGSGIGLSGAIGFYGLPRIVTDTVDTLTAPLLMLLAEVDDETPTEEYRRLRERLDDAGREYEAHVYEGAPHSFFDRAQGAWQGTCEDAWHRILAFTERHAPPVSARP